MTMSIVSDTLISKLKKAKYQEKNMFYDKPATYEFNFDFILYPERQSYLVELMVNLTGRSLGAIAPTLGVSEEKLKNVCLRLDYLDEEEARRLVYLWFSLCEE